MGKRWRCVLGSPGWQVLAKGLGPSARTKGPGPWAQGPRPSMYQTPDQPHLRLYVKYTWTPAASQSSPPKSGECSHTAAHIHPHPRQGLSAFGFRLIDSPTDKPQVSAASEPARLVAKSWHRSEGCPLYIHTFRFYPTSAHTLSPSPREAHGHLPTASPNAAASEHG